MGNYASSAELKTRLEIVGTKLDAQVDRFIAAAELKVEAYTGRKFTKDTTATARVFAATDPELLKVDDFHTTTDLVVKTDSGGDGTFDVTWAASDYQLEPLNQIKNGITGYAYGRIRAVASRCWPVSREARVEVEAQWGWAAVPAVVTEATLLQAAFLHERKLTPGGFAGFADIGVIRVSRLPMDTTAAGLLDDTFMDINRLVV